MQTRENERRDSGIIIVVILLLGFICIILASGWALRFSPSWRLNTNMGSNLNPNSDFLTSRPISFLEPLDPAILTKAIWQDVFLTPGAGASLATRTPMPTATSTVVNASPTHTPIPTLIASATHTPIFVVSPIRTRTSVPPQPVTVTPSPTNTPVTPPPSADLQITKTDGVTSYVPGGTLIYTITVRNNGTNAVTGALVTDNKPAQITSWTWVCTSQTGGANGCNGVTNSNVNFADGVNLPVGASVVYTVTANVSPTATGNLVNRADVAVPVGYTDPIPGNNLAVDTDTATPIADLSITKTDGVIIITSGNNMIYTIRVTNNGLSSVTDAILSDAAATGLNKIAVTCSATPGQCVTAPTVVQLESGVFTLPSLANGQFYEIAITANVTAPSGSVTNVATVTAPVGTTDPDMSNNSASDTDTVTPVVNLAITKTDGITMTTTGRTTIYTVRVTNNGPSNVTGAILSDPLAAGLNKIDTACSATPGQCVTAPTVGQLEAGTFALPALASGQFYEITITANVTALNGSVTNTATVAAPVGVTDPDMSDNTAADTDTILVIDTLPIEMIGPSDGNTYDVYAPACLTLNFSITVNGHAGYDFVYYEFPNGSGIFLDWAIVQVSDGSNWYTIFDWGDNYPNSNPDANTNMDFTILLPPLITPPTVPPEEPDERDIQASDLYTDPISGLSTGIAMDLDSVVPAGTYPYLRFCAPPEPPTQDGHLEIDSIAIIP